MINSVFNYTGSKYKLLEQIIPELDLTKRNFVDLFSGGGSVYLNVLHLYDKILVNDITSDLIEIHRQLLFNPNDIVERTKKLCPSKNDKESFLKLRDEYNKNNRPEYLWALMLSSTNNMMRFNNSFKYNQTFGERTFSDSTQKKIDIFVDHVQKYKDNITFSSKPFNEVMIGSKSMVYIDPPYGRIQDENGNISNKQISEAGYNCYFKKQDDINLYNYIINLNDNGHSFMVSGLLEHNGKVSWMLNKLIDYGFRYKELECDYNKVSRVGDKKSKEIIVMNY